MGTLRRPRLNPCGLLRSAQSAVNTCLTIDKAGRVVIPKPLREELHLESAGEQITLRPVRGTGQFTKEHGIGCSQRAAPARLRYAVIAGESA